MIVSLDLLFGLLKKALEIVEFEANIKTKTIGLQSFHWAILLVAEKLDVLFTCHIIKAYPL